MRHYSCDICGNPMPPKYERKQDERSPAIRLCEAEDVCVRCRLAAKSVDFKGILREAWRQASEQAADEAETETELLREKDIPMVKFSGAAGDEKREIFQRLVIYNKTHGLGSLSKIAAQTKNSVSANQLRSLIYDGTSLSIQEFRKVGKALEELESQDAEREPA